MLKKLPALVIAVFAVCASAVAQNSNQPTPAREGPPATNTNRQPSTTARPAASPSPATPADGEPTTGAMEVGRPQARARRAAAPAASPTKQTGSPAERAVRGVFETLLDGIRKADVETVMSVYWNSPDLLLFNNNGTATRSWEQVRANRSSSYPNLKNVEIEERNVGVRMLGRDAAIVTCLWRQSQESRGAPETATGRLTLVFRLVNNGWKVVHTHSSPDAPDPSRLLPSEVVEPQPTPKP